jgi:O-Antigen ligase
VAAAYLTLGQPIGTAHAALTVAGVLVICTLSRRPADFVALAGYVASCDVFWRMSAADTPWELGKYLLGAVSIVGLVRFAPRPKRIGMPMLFVALLVPGAWLAVRDLGFSTAFEAMSFNLAGPVALALVVALTTNLWSTQRALVDALWIALGPVVIVTALAWASTRGLTAQDFSSTTSNILSSGNFGPNQVSTVIGFGAVLTGFLIAWAQPTFLKVLSGGMLVWFVSEAGLTFSRGGLLNVAVGLALAGPLLVLDRQRRVRFLGVLLAGIGIVVLVVIPSAQHFTDGQFGERYTTFNTTLRRDIAAADLKLFADNPVLGVGVGEAPAQRDLEEPLATHTEYTRLLSEHGVLGLLALGTLVAMAVRSFRRQHGHLYRAWAIALVGWSMASMAHTATRSATFAFAFGLAGLVVVPDRHEAVHP